MNVLKFKLSFCDNLSIKPEKSRRIAALGTVCSDAGRLFALVRRTLIFVGLTMQQQKGRERWDFW